MPEVVLWMTLCAAEVRTFGIEEPGSLTKRLMKASGGRLQLHAESVVDVGPPIFERGVDARRSSNDHILARPIEMTFDQLILIECRFLDRFVAIRF